MSDVLLTALVIMVSLLLLFALALAAGLAFFLSRRIRGRRQTSPSTAVPPPQEGRAAPPWELRTVSSEHLTLSPLMPSDLDALYVMESDPRNFRYEREVPLSKEEVAEKLQRSMTAIRMEKPGDYLHPALRDANGNFLGTLYLKMQGEAEDGNAEIGITLTRAAQGQGHAFEAGQLLLDVAFAKLGLHRVYAEFDTRNVATSRLCEHLGMRREGDLIENRWVKGRWINTGCYAILEHEWSLVHLSKSLDASPPGDALSSETSARPIPPTDRSDRAEAH